MSDPTKLDISDYFAATVGAIVVGVGSAMTWFMRSKEKLATRMDGIEDRLDNHFQVDQDRHHEQSIALNTMQLNQQHTHERLDELREEIQVSAKEGAKKVNDKFDEVLDVLRNLKR